MFHFITALTLERKKEAYLESNNKNIRTGARFLFWGYFSFLFWRGVNIVCLALACETVLGKGEN